MDGESKENQNGLKDKVSFELSFVVPDEMPTLYANELAIQELQTEFILTFFEVRLPIQAKTNTSEQSNTVINPKCVSRVAVSVERIPDIIKALQSRFDAFIEQRAILDKQQQKAEKQ